jgi:glycosyltransferase involved in cell wall biosynthesis
VLDNPNGHIRNFGEVYRRESLRWCAANYRGHPTGAMVDRVEQEYSLADRIRVSSNWAKASMVKGGVRAEKIDVFNQPIDLARFAPASARPPEGPLRLCFVGSLDLRKGFVHLLKAIRMLGSREVTLEMVGATGDRYCRRLFERERDGLQVASAPGDPVPAYRRAEIFVMPTLEDGFGFVVAEAMACGLPVVVTDCCGALELIRPEKTGWIVPAGNAQALADTIKHKVMPLRDRLAAMGALARRDVVERVGPNCIKALHDWIYRDEKVQCRPISRPA